MPKSHSSVMQGRLIQDIERLKFDVRVRDSKGTPGKMNEKELEQYLASLPDCAGNIKPETDMPNGAVAHETLN